jgi:hypothetical protein
VSLLKAGLGLACPLQASYVEERRDSNPVYGPPPDPRQKLAPVEVFDDPWAYGLCLAVGLALTAAAWWRRPPNPVRAGAFIMGQTIVLTAPLLAFIDTYVYGSFPTIDKSGSLAFYLDGVHIRMLAHPVESLADPAARLIGVHIGHLWLTELFDLILSPIGAFNLQGLLYPALGWWCAYLLLVELTQRERVSVLLGFPFGMGLHIFRDLNWYTIEKAAVFWLPLYMWCAHRAWRQGGRWIWASALLFGVLSWMNLYLGLVAAALMAVATAGVLLSRSEGGSRVLAVLCLSALCVAPLGLWQWGLLQGGQALGTPDQFLYERAALDSFSLSPLRWNRLELHRSLNVVALALAGWSIVAARRQARVRLALVCAAVLFVLSLGPFLWGQGLENPLYWAARAAVPGFWRVAKPEVFFHGTWMLLLCVAAVQLARLRLSSRVLSGLYLLFVLAWILMVRTHPAYPPMTEPRATRLAPDWADKVFE